MANELAVIGDEPSLLTIIAQAVTDPRVDVEKMRTILEMKERVDELDAKKAFHSAMIAAQEEMRPIWKDAKGENNRYARLETIDRAIRPVYIRHGFVLSFDSRESREGTVTMSCDCMHKGGHAKTYELTGDLDKAGPKGNATKTGIMATGSTVSYLRRYLTCMIFNIVLTDEDDDAHSSRPTLTTEQINLLEDLIIACEEIDPNTRKVFLAYMKFPSVDAIPESEFPRAHAAIKSKHHQLRQRAK